MPNLSVFVRIRGKLSAIFLCLTFFCLLIFQNCDGFKTSELKENDYGSGIMGLKPVCEAGAIPKYRTSLLTKLEIRYVLTDIFPSILETSNGASILQEINKIPEITVDQTADSSVFSENNPAKLPSDIYLSQLVEVAEELFGKVVSGTEYKANCSNLSSISKCQKYFSETLAEKLWRRPLIETETQNINSIFTGSQNISESSKVAFFALMLSPQFYLKNYLPINENDVMTFSQYTLASRVSFFLYNSIPDPLLSEAAKLGQLISADAVNAHVKRLLSIPKYQSRFTSHLLARWLGIDQDLTNETEISSESGKKVKLSDAALAQYYALADLVTENKPIYDFFNQKSVFVNRPLGEFMGFSESQLKDLGVIGNEFKRVNSTSIGEHFGSYFMSAHFSSKTKTSLEGGKKTLVSRRGKYAAEKFYCVIIPPNELDPKLVTEVLGPDPAKLTQIQVGMIRSNNFGCKRCHGIVDRLGMGLEFVDAFGKPRSKYADDRAIEINFTVSEDSTKNITSYSEFVSEVANDSRLQACFIKTLSNKVAPLVATDQDGCVKNLAPHTLNLGIKDTVANIVTSSLFLQVTK